MYQERQSKYARSHYQQDGLHFIILDGCKLPFASDSFDVIVSFEVIEHLERWDDFLNECKRVLQNGGLFIFSTPNKEVSSPNSEKPWYPGHVKEFSISELRIVLANYFAKVAIYGTGDASKVTLLDKLIHRPKPKAFYLLRPYVIRIINLITRFIFKEYGFIALEEIDEAGFEAMLDNKNAKVYPIQDGYLSPPDIVVLVNK